MPGACETLVHWRDLVETMALRGQIEPLVGFDLDFQNMFGSVEWPELQAVVNDEMPEAAGWF